MTLSVCLLAAISFLMTMLFILLLKEFSFKTKLLLGKGVPLVGGLGMALAFSTTAMMFLNGGFYREFFSLKYFGIVLASMLQLTAGIVDDTKELSVPQKFLVQILSAALLIFSGVRTHIGFLGDGLNIFISFLWVIGITNAVNLLDVMDGLAAGVSLPILFSFALIGGLNHDLATGALSLTLAGALLGFLFFNFPPAKVYMGNSGSHFLGLLLSAIALMTHYASPGNEMALLAPFLILGFPLFDTIFLILMRIKKGKSAFHKSDDHLALRYLKSGHSKTMAWFLMVLLAAFFAGAGFLIIWVSHAQAAGILGCVIALSLFLIWKMNRVDVPK